MASKLPYSHWGETFSDDVVAAAMVDRLVHHAEVLTLTRRLLPYPSAPTTAHKRKSRRQRSTPISRLGFRAIGGAGELHSTPLSRPRRTCWEAGTTLSAHLPSLALPLAVGLRSGVSSALFAGSAPR
ncbi:ATP-binding protein [Mycobacterium avium subsp. paratuberculosis]|uniref:ATP-binding protein n=1 Tax=Mycobacterium avium TaxID=1764 RepID=UPI00227BEFD3|nr:ATP-binding protein [Mycobacterium avium]WAI56885.1 ATP-binding protein [Mycobacterium avium subsp. paratuberculosis]